MSNQRQLPALNWPLIALLGFIAALTPLAIDMYLPALPQIGLAFEASATQVQQTLTLFSVGFALGQLVVGPISDSVGRRRVMLVGSILFAITAILCARAESISELNLWRSLQGVAGAASGVMISAIVKDMFEQDDFSRMMSFIVLVMTLAPLVAPLIGGYVALWFGWRGIFWSLALLGLAACILVMLFIPETLAKEYRQPLAIGRSLRNYRKIFADPVSLALMCAGAFSFACLFSFLISGSYVYIELYDIDIDKVGYLFAFNVVALMILTFINGRFVGRKGAPHMLRWGLYVQFFGAMLLLPSIFVDGIIWLVVIPCMVIIGATTMVGSNLMAKLLQRHSTMAGTASSVVGSFRFGVGALIGSASTILPFNVQTNMALTIVISASASMFCYRLHRGFKVRHG
ncbi:Bcr/CflA family multidrug efflux MFS transporter [Umboniibacter marinipuniceus]|uniref:Bcr/CflA family efflux transporter n=1 Tax=Umboniibacter marinipuniceus TaxID=569599 RepID=A0A3M0A638_9GAMM|nr:Bcr/CflA family multidrug efflux MFS transporter [Umboniibacter marinipuniceus]RMA80250.1 DHA1 family bicyclomycin/chloramphenicol resistance-like MFS transporter [Umboniibacter marinipuniceus]